MYACVIFTHFNIKKIIPVEWIYSNNLERKRHYFSYYHSNIEKPVVPKENLAVNKEKLLPNYVYKIFLYKIIGK